MYLFSDIINTYRLVFSRRKYIWLLLVISTSVLLINLVLLIGVFLVRTQFLVDWKAPVSIGFLSRYVKVNQFTVDTNDLSIIWVVSNKTVLFITPLIFGAMLISSFLTGLLFSGLRYYSKECKSCCSLEKGIGVVGSSSMVIGVSSVVSSATACCGMPTFLTAFALVTQALPLTGLSVLIAYITPFLQWVGISINVAVILVFSRKFCRFKTVQQPKSN